MDELTVGFIMDLIIESNKDNCDYRHVAKQEDFDVY